MNSASAAYKDVVKLIKENELWLGVSLNACKAHNAALGITRRRVAFSSVKRNCCYTAEC